MRMKRRRILITRGAAPKPTFVIPGKGYGKSRAGNCFKWRARTEVQQRAAFSLATHIILSTIPAHLWWMAKCKGCQEWMRLGYVGPMETGQSATFSDRVSISTTCSQSGWEDEYSGSIWHSELGLIPA